MTKKMKRCDELSFLAGAASSLLLVWFLSSPSSSWLIVNLQRMKAIQNNGSLKCTGSAHDNDVHPDPPTSTFYDDPGFGYTLGSKIKGWDEKRKAWLNLHPSFASGSSNRVVMVTGSGPDPCENPIGDHLLLRAFKNKVDYCRIHGCDIFYNNAFLHPKMKSYWAKLPVVRAAMLAHPEAEWIWWVDSDAIFTDMEFEIPFERYKDRNLVVHGWSNLIYEKPSWTAINAGVFLIRNCQWSMDLIDAWSEMGPMSPDYHKWGPIQRSIFKDKMFPESDDQTALIYLLYKHKDRYFDKVYIESEYTFQGYWIAIYPSFDNVTRSYLAMEWLDQVLRRRHAEVVTRWYGRHREKKHLNVTGAARRAFVTHFTGCQPCSGHHNPIYKGETCWNEMIRALNFADDQVIRSYGFAHTNLLKSSPLSPLPFDYPADRF